MREIETGYELNGSHHNMEYYGKNVNVNVDAMGLGAEIALSFLNRFNLMLNTASSQAEKDKINASIEWIKSSTIDEVADYAYRVDHVWQLKQEFIFPV